MRILFINRSNFFIVLFSIVLLTPLIVFSATEKTTYWLDEPINLSFQNEPLSEVLKQISEQTGISIAYDQKLVNEKVSGSYQNVKTSDAITRLFRSKNKSIQVNKEKKIIIIKTFGTKNFTWATTINETPVKMHDSSEQITFAEIEALHSEQYKEYKERISDDNEILGGGMTRGEIRILHEKQLEEHQLSIRNNSEVLSGGMTRGEIHTLHKKQFVEDQVSTKNDNEILNGGMTRSEIRALHEKQYKENQVGIGDDNAILSGGLTHSEVQALHEKQHKE